jgi:hypothetical protein
MRASSHIAQDTATGPVFYIAPLSTDAGMLRVLKIRRPDPKRQERGHADFTVADYDTFKKMHLGKPGFSLIQRKDMEMIELIDPSFNVLAYYSHPTLAELRNLSTDQSPETIKGEKMTIHELKTLIRAIVTEARRVSAAHTDQPEAPVNYACIFAQSPDEYEEMVNVAGQLGPIAQDTATGPVFYIAPLSTDAGMLRVLKIRRPDPKRPERGDADFTVADYDTFKKKHLSKPGFSLIQRKDMEMIELIDPSFNVLAYYSHPTLAEVLGLSPDQSSEIVHS